jgi:hypothetical protein
MPDRIVTRCDSSNCIALEPAPGDDLALTTNRGTGQTLVTAAEVRAFAAAVKSGYFDELLGPAVGEG